MQPLLPQSPRNLAPLPQTTANAATGPIARPEQDFAALIAHIESLDCDDGPDAIAPKIAEVITRIQSQPEAKTATLLLRLLTTLQEWARSPNPHISAKATKLFHGYIDLLRGSLEYGAPELSELCLAGERTSLRGDEPREWAPICWELQDLLRELGLPLLEKRIAALRLPSTYEGTDFDVENDANPFCAECGQLIDAISNLSVIEEPMEVALKALVDQAVSGMESPAQAYDLECLAKWFVELEG